MITVEKVNGLSDQWTELSQNVDDLLKTIDVGDIDEGPHWKLFHAFAAFKLALDDTWDTSRLKPCPKCDCAGCDYCDETGFAPD